MRSYYGGSELAKTVPALIFGERRLRRRPLSTFARLEQGLELSPPKASTWNHILAFVGTEFGGLSIAGSTASSCLGRPWPTEG